MKKLLRFGILSLLVLVATFFCRKNEEDNLQNVILLNNVEALAAGETPTTMCIGTGSVDCPLHHENVKYVFIPYSLD
ncbi:NVEALA domain-containing protein [uncultured Bacteroides sp.]|uniref:NVEALA domain-containing protein n=1 Tax=uncultured Bacteroides sp. TaxID=162156 RepID=UPI0025FB9B9C|nr:NVEALA domain-containing protein [uncultured Bacteroides sp.]